MSNCYKVVFVLAAICCTLLTVLPSPAIEAYKGFKLAFYPQSKPKRVLPFPPNYSLGQIMIADFPDQQLDLMRKGAARGTITVPPGKFVIFEPAHRFFEDPKRGNVIPANGVDCFKLAAVSMADGEDGWCDRAMGYIGHYESVIKLDLDRSDCSDKGLAYAAQLPNLQAISAFAATIEGNCFEQLSKLKHLKFLFLQDNPIREENLRYLAALPQLHHLYLGQTDIGDEGVKHLSKCNQLLTLDLGGNRKITDLSVKYLLALKNLRMLVLTGTNITSGAVLQLSSLPLNHLNLPGRNYTNDQIKALQKAFPHTSMDLLKRTHYVDPETKLLLAPLH